MKTKILILILVVVLSLAVVGLALADGGLAWPRWVLSSGASESTAGDVAIHATLGQPMVGVISQGDVTLRQRFWHGEQFPESGHVYLPMLEK